MYVLRKFHDHKQYILKKRTISKIKQFSMPTVFSNNSKLCNTSFQ